MKHGELLPFLEYLEREKGIDRTVMVKVISDAICSAAKKNLQGQQEVRVEIDPATGVLQAWERLKVVDAVSDPVNEIHITQARKTQPELALGDFFEREIDPALLGRIVAKNAGQLMQQSIRRFEKEHLSAQFYPLIGTIISGIVRYQERGNTVIDFGKVEGTLYRSRAVWSDRFALGDYIACLLQNIDETPRGPELVLTRVGVEFIKQLLAREIPEIKDGTINIQAIVRAPGYRTKLVVSTNKPHVDPVGACIGSHGCRIKGVLKELGMEKVDVLRYCDDFRARVMEVVRPAVPQSLTIDEDEAGHPCAVRFALAEKDFAIFVGKNGLNLKLSSDLLGCPIHVERLQSVAIRFEDQKVQAMQQLAQWITSVPNATVARLVTMGITDWDAFQGVSEQDLVDAGIAPEEARAILQDVQAKQHASAENAQ